MKSADLTTERAKLKAPTIVGNPSLPIEASCGGKAIIVGEHAVVYGASAVAMPVHSLKMTVTLKRTDKLDKQGQPLIRMLIGGRPATAHLQGVIHDAFDLLGVKTFALDLEGHSTVMIGAGLGSSASLCVVILKAVAAASGLTLTGAELATLANQLERRFHGNPSGLDTAAVALGQPIRFRRGQSPEPLQVTPPTNANSWRFALLDSGVRSSTLSMIQVAAPYFQSSTASERIAAFDRLAEQAVTALAKGRVDLLAASMQEAGDRLAEAGVVSTPLQALMDQAKAVGCLAAKPTGAGGGGCVLALLDPRHADTQILRLNEQLDGTEVCLVELI